MALRKYGVGCIISLEIKVGLTSDIDVVMWEGFVRYIRNRSIEVALGTGRIIGIHHFVRWNSKLYSLKVYDNEQNIMGISS